MNNVIIITGPTASGKSSVSLSLCERVNGEIVSADSMQIYRYMDIGTAKPNNKDLNKVRHHMIDICDIGHNYSVAQYKKAAIDSINDIINRKKIPIITGGTGLYLDALLYNIDFHNEGTNNRDYFENYLINNGKDKLYDLLMKRDLAAALSTHPNNTKRVLRYLDILSSYEGTLEEYKRNALNNSGSLKFSMYILEMPREELYLRIEKRVEDMLKAGLVEEVEGILNSGYDTNSNALSAIGYKEIVEYLRGFCTYEEMVKILKQNTRNYAKRQITWFKKYKDAKFINPLVYADVNEIAEYIKTDIS